MPLETIYSLGIHEGFLKLPREFHSLGKLTEDLMKFKFIVITSVLICTPFAYATGGSREGQGCGKVQGEVLYHARFDWKDSMTSITKNLDIVVTKTAKPGFWDSKISARIMNHGTCEAICRADNLEVVSNEPGMPSVATSMDLTCHSSSLGALGAPATVFFQSGQNGTQTPVLRFGSWLQGYEQAYLKVQTDQSSKLVKEMRPDSAKEQVKLANAR